MKPLLKPLTNEIKNQIKLLSILLLCGGYYLFIDAFLRAYFSPSKSVTIYINRFSEANLEIGIIIVMSIIIIMGLYLIAKDYLSSKIN